MNNTEYSLLGIDVFTIQGSMKREFKGYDGYSLDEKSSSTARLTFLSRDFGESETISSNKYSNGREVKTSIRKTSKKISGPALKVDSQNNISIGVSLEAALILGIKLDFEIGLKEKKKN